MMRTIRTIRIKIGENEVGSLRIVKGLIPFLLKSWAILLLLFTLLLTVSMETYADEKEPLTETLTIEGPVFTEDGEEFAPAETKELNGKTYHLVEKRIRKAKKEGELTFAKVSISYKLEADDTVPGVSLVPLVDEESGTEFERELPLLDTEEVSGIWEEGFSFPITVSGYGADSFYLGEKEIAGDDDLSVYGEELLKLAGLSGEYYRVDQVEWNGEPYEKDGVICRNATAKGQKRIRTVKANYGGQIRTPDIEGKQYIGIYEEVIVETDPAKEEPETEKTAEVTEIQKETAMDVTQTEKTAASSGILKKIGYWMISHVTFVTISMGALILLSAGIWLLLATGKKTKESPCQAHKAG